MTTVTTVGELRRAITGVAHDCPLRSPDGFVTGGGPLQVDFHFDLDTGGRVTIGETSEPDPDYTERRRQAVAAIVQRELQHAMASIDPTVYGPGTLDVADRIIEACEGVQTDMFLSRFEDGTFDFTIPHWFGAVMLKACRAILDEHDADNYVEMSFSFRNEPGRYTVTVGRPDGRTPTQLRLEAEHERDEALAEIARHHEDFDHIRSVLDDPTYNQAGRLNAIRRTVG